MVGSAAGAATGRHHLRVKMCCVRVALHPPQWAEARLETRPTPLPTDVPHRSVGSRHASQSSEEVWLHRTRLCCLCIACTSLTRRIDRLAFADDEPPTTTTPPSPLPSPPSSPLQRPASPMELIGYVHVKSVAWWRPVKKKAVLSALLASPLSHSHAHSASDVPRPATYKVKLKRCLKRAM